MFLYLSLSLSPRLDTHGRPYTFTNQPTYTRRFRRSTGPIIDPQEFRERFIANYQNLSARRAPAGYTANVSPADALLGLMANILVTWAASYGIDEFGREDADVGSVGANGELDMFLPAPGKLGSDLDPAAASSLKRRRRDRCNAMVREMLAGVDRLALLRRPSWDGVRVLMLLMPLTEGASV